MGKSVPKFSPSTSVDNRRPSREALDALVAERIATPKVKAYELAERLGISPSQLSTFETGAGPLPFEMGADAYRKALEDLKRAKRQGAAA